MSRKDSLFAAIAVLLVAALAYLWLSPSGLEQAPDITVTTVKGEQIALKSLRGKPVLVNFWATSCPGCVKEMPELSELYRDLAPKGLSIIGIAMFYDPPSNVLTFIKQHGVPYPIALDPKSEAAKAFGGVQLIPTSFLIDPDGKIVKAKLGEVDINALRQQIEAMLPKS